MEDARPHRCPLPQQERGFHTSVLLDDYRVVNPADRIESDEGNKFTHSSGMNGVRQPKRFLLNLFAPFVPFCG